MDEEKAFYCRSPATGNYLLLFSVCREKKKEKEREELWKQLEKLELESRNKSTSSASNPAASNPNPASNPGTSKNAKS